MADNFYQIEPLQMTSITTSRPPVVTVPSNTTFKSGMAVRFHIPASWGMQQITTRIFPIKVTSDTTFEVYETLVPEFPLDARFFNPFSDPNNGTVADVAVVGSLPIPQNNLPWEQATVYADSQIKDATANVRQ